MKSGDERIEMTDAILIVKSVAVLRRFLSMTEVVHDVTDPWLEGGRADEIINSSKRKTDAIDDASWRLLTSLRVAQMLLGMKSGSLEKYESEQRTAQPPDEKSEGAKFEQTSKTLLSLVCDGAGETADHIRAISRAPHDWAVEQGLHRNKKSFDYVLGCLDYYRWQILKQFARLVVIFDDRDDPDSKESSQEWPKDKAALDKADLVRCKERVC